MASLTAVESDSRPAGLPEWISPALQMKAGRDPLALMTITQDRIMPILVPAILALSDRARYFTFFPFLLDEFERRALPPSNELLSEFIKLREFELACAVQLCPRGHKSIGATGANAASAAVGEGGDRIARRESVESFLGGYGLYYRSPLIDLGVVIPRGTPYGADEEAKPTPVDVLRRDERARELAAAYRTAIQGTVYYKDWFVGEGDVPIEVLVDFAEHGCLCRLGEVAAEQALVRELLFENPPGEQPEFVSRDVEQRKRSFALFLHSVERDPDVAGNNDVFRDVIWDEFIAKPTRGGAFGETLAQWAALSAKDYWQDGLSSIFADFCRLGRREPRPDGITREELEQLIRGRLLGAGSISVEKRRIKHTANLPTRELLARIEATAGDLPLISLANYAIEEQTGISGLLLVLALMIRLPELESTAAGWRDIGLRSSERQPSVLGFARLFELHLSDEPSVGDTLSWLVHHFVIGAHEQVAYSKLPDFTFRFRWENGLLRFYSIGGGRFEIADIRRSSMSQLTEDLGMRSDGDEPRLTKVGSAFVKEVLG